MKNYSTPEIIASLRSVNADGEDRAIGDRIIGIQVEMDEKTNRDGMVQLDVRDFGKKDVNLIIEVPLPELMAALSTATLNRDAD